MTSKIHDILIFCVHDDEVLDDDEWVRKHYSDGLCHWLSFLLIYVTFLPFDDFFSFFRTFISW